MVTEVYSKAQVDQMGAVISERISASSDIGLPIPQNIDESDSTYFYFGWESVNGGWLVRRVFRSSAVKLDATQLNNSAYVDLPSAWAQRTNLVFE